MPLARRTDLGDSAYAGLEVDVCGDLQRCLADTLAGGLDFLVAPLAHPRHRRPSAAAASRDPSAPTPAPFARSDLLLNSAQWSSQVVGKTSPWIDADSPSAPYRADSEAALRQELGWAAHLSLHAVLLPPPRLGAANYARIVCQFLGALSHTALWVRVPLVDPAVEAAEAAAAFDGSRRRARVITRRAQLAQLAHPESLASAVDACTRRRIHDPFEAWAFLRAACEGHPQLGVCLHVGASLPSDGELARWIGEPVRAIVVAEDAFTTNKRRFPVLPKRHQEFLTSMLRRNVQVVLRAAGGDGDRLDVRRAGTETQLLRRTRSPRPRRRRRRRRRRLRAATDGTRLGGGGSISSTCSARSRTRRSRSSWRLGTGTTSRRRSSR